MNFSLYKFSYNKRRSFLIISLFISLVFIQKINAADTIYIDPGYVGTNSDGSLLKPYVSWSDLSSFKDNTSYLQKRGTTCILNEQLSIYHKINVHIGVYGKGTDYAHIHNNITGNNSTFSISASDHCIVDGLHLTGSYEALSGIRLTDDWQVSTYPCIGTKITNCFIEKFHWGIRMIKSSNSPFDTVLVEDVKINEIYDDGIFVQGWGTALHGLDINNCYIDSVNMAYQETNGGGESIAGGDGIQLSRLVDGWKIRNTTVDRRNSSNKFCIIHNDEGDTRSCSGIVENCTLFAPSVGHGGNACYFDHMDSICFRYNHVYSNERSSGIANRNGTALQCYYNVFSKMGEGLTSCFNLGGQPNNFYNNSFYGTKKVFTYISKSAAEATSVINNVFSNAGEVFDVSFATAASDYNLYFNSTGNESEPHSIYDKDPLFANPESGDFHLTKGSPCINNGKDLGFTSDIEGTLLPQANDYEMGAYEFISADQIAPSAPTALSSSSITCISFVLSWDASTDNDSVIGYNIYKEGVFYAFTSLDSVSINDLTQGTSYSMTVKAKDGSGNLSDLSSELVVNTLASSDNQSPSTPIELSASRIGQTYFTITWTASTDNVSVKAYDIYLDGQFLATTDTSKYLIAGLTPATNYSVCVAARDSVNNNSEKSSPLAVITRSLCGISPDWANESFDTQTDTFTVEFDVMPESDNMDGIVGISNGSASTYSSLACIIQFNVDGTVKARNGSNYMSDMDLMYFAEISYHIKFIVSISTHTYDIFVTPTGEDPVAIGTNYSFRSEQAAVSQINNYAVKATLCSLLVTNFSISGNSGTIPEDNKTKTISFDFGDEISPTNWNNVSLTTQNISGAINTEGETTSVGLNVYDAFSSVNFDGPTGLDASVGIPDAASGDSFWGSAIEYAGFLEPTGGIEINGLNPAIEYKLVILSSRMNSSGNRETNFKITGAATNTLAINSVNNSSTISGTYKSAADGTIKIDVSPGQNNDNSLKFYYFSTLQLSYDIATGLSSFDGEVEPVIVFPNPATNELNVKVTNRSELAIMDVTGKILQYGTVDKGNNNLQLDLKTGVYFLRVVSSDNSISTSKLIVR
jgi:chitodextrinase